MGTVPELRNCTNAALNCRNKRREQHQCRLATSLRINNFLISLSFHCKVTAVPFTSVHSWRKQASIGAIDQTISGARHARKAEVPLIAIVDDNELMQDSLGDLIESGGFEAQSFGSAKAFLDSDLHRTAACLIVDIRMPKMSGLELQARLKKQGCDVPIIFITAFDDAEIRAQAMREGAVDFLAKPFNHLRLLKLLRDTLNSETRACVIPHLAIAS